jgi:DUF1365 family protein
MVLQMVLGGLASLAVALKMFGRRLWSYFTFWKKDEDKGTKPAQPDSPAAQPAAPVETEKEPV